MCPSSANPVKLFIIVKKISGDVLIVGSERHGLTCGSKSSKSVNNNEHCAVVLKFEDAYLKKFVSTDDRCPTVDWMDGVIKLGTESYRSKVSSSQAKRTNSYRASRDY
ncbi:hypothetical protein [Nostoc sp. LEGE 12450]|uniref:hypothetical protein n=1 Tax=Nostoc sp. LEGE 12450 TaxID=1828643 RepID=UPI00187EB10F|nr:hypothetical protein [Nostoc sp. LEGE 12450]MBE8992694.1 hypothetical protein [Nostoc sp. LEGE 12450]